MPKHIFTHLIVRMMSLRYRLLMISIILISLFMSSLYYLAGKMMIVFDVKGQSMLLSKENVSSATGKFVINVAFFPKMQKTLFKPFAKSIFSSNKTMPCHIISNNGIDHKVEGRIVGAIDRGSNLSHKLQLFLKESQYNEIRQNLQRLRYQHEGKVIDINIVILCKLSLRDIIIGNFRFNPQKVS